MATWFEVWGRGVIGGKESVEGLGVVGRDWAGDAARGVDDLVVSADRRAGR